MPANPGAAAALFAHSASAAARTRVGIGGWTFAPWRGRFDPPKLVQRRELDYASRHLGAMEVNGTCHGAQKPATCARWREETRMASCFRCRHRAARPKERNPAAAMALIERL